MLHMTKRTGPKRLYYAMLYSMKGLRAAFINEPAFRYEVVAAALLCPAAFLLAESAVQLSLLLGSCLLVLTFELVNTAIEAVVDRAGTEYHALAGIAKDVGSAAVFLMLLFTAVTWLAILWENGLAGWAGR